MKIKTKWLTLGMALTVMSAMAGCGTAASDGAENMTETSAEEYVQAAKEALAEADSFVAEFEATVDMDDSGETFVEGTITKVQEPLYVNADTRMVFDGIEQEYDIYLEESEDTINQYMKYDGQWTEMTLTEDTALLGVKIYDTAANMQSFLEMAENWSVEEAGTEIVLTAVIPEEKCYAVEESGRLFQLAGMSGLSEVYFNGVGDVPITMTLDGKSGEPVSYEIDLAKALETVTNNVLKELGGGTLENGVTVAEYSIDSRLLQLGGVEAEPIPTEAKNDAINYEKEISMLEGTE